MQDEKHERAEAQTLGQGNVLRGRMRREARERKPGCVTQTWEQEGLQWPWQVQAQWEQERRAFKGEFRREFVELSQGSKREFRVAEMYS